MPRVPRGTSGFVPTIREDRDDMELKVNPAESAPALRILLYCPDNGVTRNFMPHSI